MENITECQLKTEIPRAMKESIILHTYVISMRMQLMSPHKSVLITLVKQFCQKCFASLINTGEIKKNCSLVSEFFPFKEQPF